jgi:hypothetical protein
MAQLVIKAQLNNVYEDRRGVALVFGAVGEDGANDAWTPAGGPESAFRLEMTTSAEAVQNAGLTVNQRYTLTFDLDDRHATVGDGAIVAPPETTTHTVVGDDGELTEVSAAEARDRGYETGVGGASGLAVGPQQHAPVLSLPETQVDAETGQPVYDESGHEGYDARQPEREGDAYGTTPAAAAPREDAPHGVVHDETDERPQDGQSETVIGDEPHLSTAAEHDEHRDDSAADAS